MHFIAKLIYKIIGWEVLGEYPYHVKKKIIIAAPHTSNWDFPIGVLARAIFKDKIKFVGKKSLFKPPLGWLMTLLGGVPVDRNKSTNFVRAIVEEYNQRDRFTVVIAPEGHRRRVNSFKSGFYFIALQANIPIVPIVFDWEFKKIRVLDIFIPQGDSKEDIKKVENLFRGVKGKVTSNSFL